MRSSVVSRWRGLGALVASVLTLSLVSAGPAQAFAPVGVVHTEHVHAGPYQVTVGFSTWPVRAMQSLDFTFMPAGGVDDKSGTLWIAGPGVRPGHGKMPLVRHPRKRESWGLDVKALDDPGTYSFTFAIDGPLGHGEGVLPNLEVLEQPGPPLPLSWTISVLPLLGLLVFLAVVWRRTKPGRVPLSI